MDVLPEDRHQDVMVNGVETSLDVTFDEPLRSVPDDGDFSQGRVTPSFGPKPMGVG